MMMMMNLSGSVQCKVGAEWEGAAVGEKLFKAACPSDPLFWGTVLPPPLVGPWDFEIWRPNLNVAVDAIGPETDFTLETDGKMCTKNKWTFLQNPKFHL